MCLNMAQNSVQNLDQILGDTKQVKSLHSKYLLLQNKLAK